MNKCISSRYIDVLGLCIVHIMIQANPSIKLMENATLLYIFLVRIWTYAKVSKCLHHAKSPPNK